MIEILVLLAVAFFTVLGFAGFLILFILEDNDE